jgi:hypothetical protein
MAALNTDVSDTEDTGSPEPQTSSVTIEASVKDDLHLGDERVIYGRGNGMHGEIDPDTREPFAYPSRAKVVKEIAEQLVEAGLAKLI